MTVWGGGFFKKSGYLKKDFGVPKYPIFTPPKTRIFWGFLGGTPISGGNTPRIGVKMDPTPASLGGGEGEICKVKFARWNLQVAFKNRLCPFLKG